jgi:Txe/YoeB family toxin of Txe-Axe toxin-antitoxin module
LDIKNRDSIDETFEELVTRCMKEWQEDIDNECRLLISVNNVEMGVLKLRFEHYKFHIPVRNQTS